MGHIIISFYVRHCSLLGGYSCSCNMLSKLRQLKDHPANKVLKPHWMNRSRKYNENTDPIYNKVFTFLDKINIPECETVSYLRPTVAQGKKCKVDLSVSTAGSKEQNPTLLCALANEQLQTTVLWKIYPCIYRCV